MKRILAMVLALAMIFVFAGCGGNDKDEALGMSASPLDSLEIKADYEIADDFKIGFICLHDEQSTYDLNFLNAAEAVQKALGLKDEQVIIKTNVPEPSLLHW